ncbi:hypothetical protein R3P38DRAFT_3244637 [Favolaschia claudopus]|uniref:Uncharacterized protein n=1 Tax=Favolaschia claudopus TaxID=2862362 RepID=A0AAV9Z1K0_9AGAR
MADTLMNDTLMQDSTMRDALDALKHENVKMAAEAGFPNPSPNPSDPSGPSDPSDPGNGNMLRALSYEVYGTSIISGLPPVQKEKLISGWRRRHLEEEQPERANAEIDEEVHARTATSYDISCQYLKNAHAMALFNAEERAEDLNFDTDSDDDDASVHGREEFHPEDIIIWDGTRPELTAHTTTDAGSVADEAVAKAVDADTAEDLRTANTMAARAVFAGGVFNFVPASLLVDAEALDMNDVSDSERRAAPSPIPSLEAVSDTSVDDLYRGEPMATVERSGEGEAEPAARQTHQVQLVNVYGARVVQCGCQDGKHFELRRRQTFAFEASDGTVVVKKFRTMIVALNQVAGA